MAEYESLMPFWIDTDAYSKWDREMFVCGFEFGQIYRLVSEGWRGTRPIHRENESRFRMMCAHLGVACRIDPHEDYEGCETWSDLSVHS